MKIRFVVVGKPSREFLSVIVDFEKRLPKYCSFEVFEVKDESGVENKLKGTIVVLDVRGKQLSSEALSSWLRDKEAVTFVIGGAEGLSSKVKQKANFLLSFSQMTFPHQLARLILTEQVYRAFTILKNEKYHK
ncbi:23S rRNA (pseudouridine(1915)-N(3))-methyltransferase RlmH [Candidatus Woesearchaeota archaeon CG10_big_fil_rev_8_21_14_0_10_37_12]|nr:MAG: 23S rRNA (pseudouridine(1915)-N(3))-methyltransferase RlmH [Candidatus Woesearchaeota archaeon CG10_big_fil_rev_8_21_14_0_10_37_12]